MQQQLFVVEFMESLIREVEVLRSERSASLGNEMKMREGGTK